MKINILIVCVLYNSIIEQCESYKSLIKNGKCDILFIDHSKNSQIIPNNIKNKATYYWNPNNPGLSNAYNYGANYAKNNGYNWILLCDQDTHFAEFILDDYIAAVNKNPTIPIFTCKIKTKSGKIMSPLKLKHHQPNGNIEKDTNIIHLKETAIINSGMLINVESFLNVGGYNEKVFLDYSDYQFIQRMSKYYRYGYVIPTICTQDFSNETQNNEQKIFRFSLFCKSLKGYECTSIIDKIDINFIVLKRALSLIIRTKKAGSILHFLKSFYK